MRAHLIRGLHHARRGLFYTLAAALVLVAVAVAIADRLLPLVQAHPDRIAAWLMQRSGRPIAFSRAEAHWTSRGPLFTLHDLRIGKGADQLVVDRAQLLVAMYSGVLPGHPFTELRLRGLALTVERDAGGRWKLIGLSSPHQAPNAHPLSSLEGLGELQVSDARLTVQAPAQGFSFTAPKVALRMRVDARRVRAGVRMDAAGRAPLLAVLDFDRRNDAGSVWIGSDDFDLAPWSGFLDLAGVQMVAGRGRLQVWSGIADSRLDRVQVEAALHDVGFVGGSGQVGGSPSRVDLASLAASARLSRQGRGWQFVAPRLRLRGKAGGEDALDGLALRTGGGVTLAAPRLDAGVLLSIATLAASVPDALRGWLLQAAPHVRVSDVRVQVAGTGAVHGRAHLDDLSWQPVERTPAIKGLAGSLVFDGDAIALTLDKPDPAKRPFYLLWPPAYGDPIPFALRGELTAYRDDADWVLESSALHAHNDDLDLQTRLAMRFRPDGRKPRLDLFATLGPAQVVSAKHYWLRHKMPAKTVAWLDGALQGGQIAGGHVIVAGDLADWPFRHGEGRFDAVADLRDARLRFNPGWPDAEHLDGQVVFDGPGMRLTGSAAIAGVQVPQLSAAIPSFHEGVLDVQAQAVGSGKNILALLRNSPLKKRFGDGLATLDLRGPDLHGNMHLIVPLHHELGEPTVAGDVDLAQVKLADPRWGVDLTDVGGRVHYDQDGVLADALDVKLAGDPAKLRLAIGKKTGDEGMAVVATLNGVLPASTLLDHAPALSWLRPLVVGRSFWTVDVRVPHAAAQGATPPAQLSLRSDLRGSALKLPAPLAKNPGPALRLQATAPLPASGGEIMVALGNVLEVRGRYDEVRGFRGLLSFGRAATGPLPEHGLIASGQVDSLDAAGWIGFASGPSAVAGASGLQTVDVRTDDLLLGGRHFPDVRVRLSRPNGTTALQLDGAAVAGSVAIGNEPTRSVRGQFQRLYWPGASTSPGGAITAEDDTRTDPADVPPLHVEVADLRFGDAHLGHVVLQTRPIAQGLHIDQLDASAPSQTLTASGAWTRNGSGTRTQLAIQFKADSLGKMLDAFGFKGMVAGGKTKATLTANWPGSPTAFRMAALDGTLDLDVGEGRLLEVKPGAGRILGLVSVAELPRRLTLDFKDFFDKGFGFNTLKGRFVFEDGVARTDNMAIKGPAADIHLRGSADLARQQYDQTIDVLPKSGGLATVVGAAVAGPVGAAVGAVAGEVLKKPLQQMGHKRYHVTGPWSHPEVKVVPVEG